LGQFEAASREYEEARREILAALRAKEHIVKKETIDIIENNLNIIEGAIGEIKSAVGREPGDERLVLMLADAYHKETDVLLTVRDLLINANQAEDRL
jgi:hypothetical protein